MPRSRRWSDSPRGFGSASTAETPYNLKDLLVEIALSPWFRAESMSQTTIRCGRRRSGLAGVEAPAHPGRTGMEDPSDHRVRLGPTNTQGIWDLDTWGFWRLYWPADQFAMSYRLLYGGIDSEGIHGKGG